MDCRLLWKAWTWQVMYVFYFVCWGWSNGQLHYTVVEESDPGTVIGNVARDLGLNVEHISERRLRLGPEESKKYFAVKLEMGDLLLNEKIDRETLCGPVSSCLLPVELIIEKPLELFRIIIEILDINDNSPHFVNSERLIKIAELAAPGLRFPLENAIDPDVGTNAVISYKMSPSQHFALSVKQLKDGKLFPELVLEHTLDREEIGEHQLILTALDGGHPPRSGTTKITIQVLDNNDNPPTFDQPVYKTSLLENIQWDTLLIKLNATDLDDGLNSEIEYSFADHTANVVERLFRLDPISGEIHVQGEIDFEESSFYEIYIRARDKGIPVMEGHCVIQVEIEDSNDNAPEIFVTSLEYSVAENTPVGTVVGLFNIIDRDSGKNGEVQLQLSAELPFQFLSLENHYSLITDAILDRETMPQYNIHFIASDLGVPPLFTEKTLNISDVNDNAPLFSQPFFYAFIHENNLPGMLLCKISATDIDEGTNALLTFSVMDSYIAGSPISSFIYINENNGNVYAQRSFDYEHIQHLEIPVFVEDRGSPILRTNATIHIFVLDQNDNHPTILYPVWTRETTEHQKVPRHVSIGYLVTKITAVDADSGYNAWLTYSILQATDPTLFQISPHTGEIRVMRHVLETDENTNTIFVLVRDNGEPALSSTAAVIVSFEEVVHDETPKSQDFQISSNEQSDVTLYLIISLVAIIIVSLVTFTVLTIKCLKTENAPTMCESFPCHPEPSLQIHSESTLKYMEVKTIPRSSVQSYKTCYSPALDRTDFTFLRPLDFPQLKDILNDPDSSFSLNGDFDEQNQQAQPNADWRFSQAAQKPGPSGTQPTEEAGVWPNNQFETERLQAMILASANEAAEGTSGLGGGTGTMGLSARYGPQFTLQHVPDYRQNVYIPGSTLTPTNGGGKREGKGNKKKSSKKDKK
ncbi:protocadherin gamma subfamily A, 3 L homeolog isoform X38 [Xenopus laevis]|uniref:Protocadherin gamma-C5 n=1 Tax=Xenopus laevis TaxID=8355 RepID=A0A8J1MHJ1_XENLA|nr:protocadherin gamma subfamily A, 3 L homeolog isoform X38 [Xenopus laevis]